MGIYIHWLVTPFFTIASLVIWVKDYLFSQNKFKNCLLRREELLAKGKTPYSPIVIGFICTIMPILAAFFSLKRLQVLYSGICSHFIISYRFFPFWFRVCLIVPSRIHCNCC
jgi:hypothetical protein